MARSPKPKPRTRRVEVAPWIWRELDAHPLGLHFWQRRSAPAEYCEAYGRALGLYGTGGFDLADINRELLALVETGELVCAHLRTDAAKHAAVALAYPHRYRHR